MDGNLHNNNLKTTQRELPPLPTVTERDRAKIEKKMARDEAIARAAFDAHRVGRSKSGPPPWMHSGQDYGVGGGGVLPGACVQVEAEAAARGRLPEIIRNAGAAGCRDIHLDDFNISNGED